MTPISESSAFVDAAADEGIEEDVGSAEDNHPETGDVVRGISN